MNNEQQGLEITKRCLLVKFIITVINLIGYILIPLFFADGFIIIVMWVIWILVFFQNYKIIEKKIFDTLKKEKYSIIQKNDTIIYEYDNNINTGVVVEIKKNYISVSERKYVKNKLLKGNTVTIHKTKIKDKL